MCGIVGYVGHKNAKELLKNGLRRLEYRGYDSAGIAVSKNGEITYTKAAGKVANLDIDKLAHANSGIGHTRWATHGAPTTENAHPHTIGKVTLVHNGIIENYNELKEELINKGVIFQSQTDTEVLAALIDDLAKSKSTEDAIRTALRRVAGTFGVAVLVDGVEDCVFVARRGSPVLVGIGDDEHYIASDAAAVVEHTDRVIYLEDDQLAIVRKDSFEITDLENNYAEPQVQTLEYDHAKIEKQGFDHFLIKEIFDQPEVIKNCLRGRLDHDGSIKLQGLEQHQDRLRQIERIIIVGCGTAFFAGQLGKYLLERMTNITVDVEYGSEFRYRDTSINPDKTLALFMSQSGETADTLASLQKMKELGVLSLGLVNVVGSTLAREVDGGIYLHAGPEISVASTKAYSTMVSALMMVGLYIGGLRGMTRLEQKEIARSLLQLPEEVQEVLNNNKEIKQIAKSISKYDHSFYLGRENLYPVALEGSLKLMEVSYMQSQAYPTGEMKHGPIALIEPSFLTVVLMPEEELLYSKTVSNIQEIKARNGYVVTVGSKPKLDLVNKHIETPKVSHWIEPLIINVVLQLIAYHVAVERGNDVDQPRNLAKSVTVE